MSRIQLLEQGVTGREVDRCIERGELRPIHRGVFVVGPIDYPGARQLAAVLASGPTAVVSHTSAAHLYELLPYPAQPEPVQVTVTDRHHRKHPNIVVHRTDALLPHEIRRRSNTPVTAPPRTLIDLASGCMPGELEAAVAEAFALRLTNRAQLLRAMDACGPRRGTVALRRLLDAPRGPARTRSPHERRFLALVRAAGLPEPEVNARVGRWEVDFLWQEARLVVEVDAYSTHSSPAAFERDRLKTAELEDLGHAVHRVTPARFVAELARLRRAL